MRRVIVIIKRPRQIGSALTYARHIATCMTGNPYFPSPRLPIATLLAHIAEAEAAHVEVLTGRHGAASERDAKLLTVIQDLEQLAADVNWVVFQRAEDALAVAVSSGMSVKQTRGPAKWAFGATPSPRTGEVLVRFPRRRREESFDLQVAVAGEPWGEPLRVSHAKKTIAGLTPGVLYHFRYRTFLREVLGDWSDPFVLRAL
jgi:hypothetical protein